MNVLIVDDEVFTVRAIQTTLDWESFGIDRTFSAYNAAKAREIIREESIDLMICDIEMPKEDGLSLVSWIRENGFSMEVIFLTCHSEFEYARKALKLQVFDYVVKPVDFDEMGKTVAKAVEKIRQDRQEDLKTRMGEYVLENRKLMEERFWQELLWSKKQSSPEEIEENARHQGIAFDKDHVYRLILVSVKKIKILLRHWKDDLILFTMDNLAKEIILQDLEASRTLRMGDFIVIIMGDSKDEDVEALCRKYTQVCGKFLGISVFCYISNRVFCEELGAAYESLVRTEKDDVAGTEEIVWIDQRTDGGKPSDIEIPEDLKECLIHDDREGFWEKYSSFMGWAVENHLLDYSTMKNILQDILQMFFVYMERHHIHAHRMSLPNFENVETVEQMNQWVKSCLDLLLTHQPEEKLSYNELVIEKVKNYILNHLGEPLSRDSIAGQVNLSPDYMSKIFKNITGKNLSQYIVDERMEKAVLLMRTSRLNVSQIAAQVGCDNFSYFSKLFKKHTGVTPREYRSSL